MSIPITGVSQTIELITLIIAYLFVWHHVRQAVVPVLNTIVSYLQKYLLFFAIFNFFLAAPHIVLFFQPDLFSPFMAWGYSIAHIFVFISLAYLSRAAIKVIPSLAHYDWAVITVWAVITITLTAANIFFVTLQHPPYFDPVSGLTKFEIPSFIGIAFGNISMLAYLPLIGLFIYSAVKSQGTKRLRAVLIGTGMLVTMVGGPLHAIAQNWQIYILADILNILGLALVAFGIILQIDQSLSIDKQSQQHITS